MSTLSEYCPTCEAKITTSLRYHKRMIHQVSVGVKYPNQAETDLATILFRGTDTFFRCRFCVYYSSDPSQLQSHASKQCAMYDAPACVSSTEGTDIDRSSFETPTSSPEVVTGEPSKPLQPIQNSDYHREPDAFTVVSYPPYDLQPFGFVVNTVLQSFICLSCSIAVPTRCLCTHLKTHVMLNPPPATLIEALRADFGISDEGITWPDISIDPIYPLPIVENPLHFCSFCNKGYKTDDSLRTHQNGKCPSRDQGRRSHMGYGQLITIDKTRRYIQVDIGTLTNKKVIDYAKVFMSQPPPFVDHSLYPISGPEDDMNLNSFFASDGWLAHVEGLLPADLVDARRTSETGDSMGEELRNLALRYLQKIQLHIRDNITFGIMRTIGSVNMADSSKHAFKRIQPKSVTDYSLVLHRLILSCVRFYDGVWTSSYHYPQIDESQQNAIHALRIAVEDKLRQDALCKTQDDLLAVQLKCLPKLDDVFHKLCFKLFAHTKYQYDASRRSHKFFSPVICFIIIHCIDEKGGVETAGAITAVIAAIMYSIRATVSFELHEVCQKEAIDTREALKRFLPYLQDQHESPMSFAYNATVLLGIIRGNEMNEGAFTFTDSSYREVSHNGKLISVPMVKRMIEGTLTQYTDRIQKIAFFGEEIPTDIFPSIDISKLVDNQQNRSPGYSFIDDPKNGFDQYRQSYGQWFLSDAERAEKFVRWDGKKLVWKSEPTQRFLKDLQECRELLAVGTTLSAGPSARSTEVTRRTLRNVPGAPRSFRILYHNLCLVDIQDKTSHKSNKDLFVPHAPTREWATALILNIVLLRPFEQHLVEQLFPMEPIVASRYRYQLWPGITEAMTGDRLSDRIGRVTEEYLDDKLKIRLWRELVSTLSSQFDDPRLLEYHKEYYVDKANMHSTTASVNKYGGFSIGIRGVDPRMVVGCIKAGIEWHKLVDVGQAQPLSVGREVEQEEEGGRSKGSTQGAELGELSGRSISGIAQALIDKLLPIIQDRTVDTINDAIAECSQLYFPKPPAPSGSSLQSISDIAVHPSRLKDLRKFFGNPKAHFSTPEQGVLLEHALSGRENILGILGTGFGKTTMIMMMAKMYSQGRVIVVVLPLSALHDDLDRRAKEYGLRISRWSPDEFNPSVHIVTVAVEYLGDPRFRSYLSDLHLQNSLFQLVFDEIHKVITDSNFRDVFRQFWTLKLVPIPILGLTGSLPETLMPVFHKLTGLSWKILRMSSNRKELVYGVITVPKGIPLAVRIREYIQGKLAQYERVDRAIIFCRTTAAADEMAGLLNVDAFHSRSTVTNPPTMHAWRTGANRVMVSTSILGCGLDYPSIRDVLHMDLAHSMLDMYQEDSRGGRDGRSCCALTFIPEGRRKPPKKDTYPIGEEEVYEWATQKDQCLRIIPSLFLDGVAITCTLLKDAQLCLVCAAQANKPPPLKPVLLPMQPTLQSASVTPNQPSAPPPFTFVTPKQKSTENRHAATPFIPPAHVHQATATPSTLHSHRTSDITGSSTPYAPAFVTPRTPFLPPREETPTPTTLHFHRPDFTMETSTFTRGHGEQDFTTPTTLGHRPEKRSLPTDEKWPIKHPRLEREQSPVPKIDFSKGYASSKRTRFAATPARSFTADDLGEMLGLGSSDELGIPVRPTTPFAGTRAVTPQNHMPWPTNPPAQQASSSRTHTYQTPHTPASPTPQVRNDYSSSRHDAQVGPKSKAGVAVRQEHKGAKERAAQEWIKKVDTPLRTILDVFRGKCISCYFSGDARWGEHTTDNCRSHQMSGMDTAFVSFRDRFELPPGHCYGCTLSQKRSDHGLVSGLRCPDNGIIVRLCYAYRIAIGAGTLPLHPTLDPNFVASDQFLPWLLQPHDEEYDNYWMDPKKVRFNVWLFVIWLGKECNIL